MTTTKVLAITLSTIFAAWPIDVLADGDEGARLAEIVVTAQKRVEDLDKVPISISVLDRAELEAQGVRNMSDIYQVTPGVNYQEEGPFRRLSIRGISSGAGAATAGIYIDDVPVQTRFPELNLIGPAFPEVFDLDRVEILRGPQGTYFGAGAESGAIRFITPQPSLTESSGYTREGINGTDVGGIGYEAGVAVGGPLVDNEVGYRVSVSHQSVGGYVDHFSTIPGGYRDSASNWSNTDQIKGALLFQPNDNLKITPQIFLQQAYTHNLAAFDPNLSSPSTGTYVNGGLLPTPDTNDLALSQLKVEYTMGGVTLTSISAYLYRNDSYDFDYTNIVPMELGLPLPTNPIDFTNVPYVDTQKNITQEIRLQNNDSNAKLKWVAGLWYSIARQETDEFAVEPNFNNYLEQQTGKSLVQTLGSGLLEPGNFSFVGLDAVHDRQLAAYGQMDWEVISHLTLTAGVRVTKQSNDFSLTYEGPLGGGTSVSTGTESEHVTTPKYAINYQIDDHNMIYVSASKGNRLGGGNAPFLRLPSCLGQLAELGLPANPGSYASDFVWNYELGSKNRLFDNRLEIETSIFRMNWTDLQQSIYVPDCATSFTANIGKAFSEGFELQINALLTDNLKVSSAIGYDNARIAKTVGIPGGAVIVNNGDQIDPTQSPWIISGALEYDFRIFQDQKSYARVDDEFHSKNPGPFTFQNPDSASYIPQLPINPSQNILNLRLGTLTHGWDIALYAKNVANAHPLLNVALPTELAPAGHAYTLQPRTVGITGDYHW